MVIEGIICNVHISENCIICSSTKIKIGSERDSLGKKMRQSFLISLLAIGLIISSSAFAKVSDVKLEAMEGKNVSITIDGGQGLEIDLAGELTKVSSKSVVIITKNGKVREIPKTKIISISKSKRARTSDREVMGPWGPFALNLVIGLGIGSYVQGDKVGGTTGLVWDLLNYSAFGIAAAIAASQAGNGNSSGAVTTVVVVNIIGGISILAGRIYQVIRPFSYYKKNVALLESFYLLPDVAYSGDVSGLKVGFQHNFKF